MGEVAQKLRAVYKAQGKEVPKTQSLEEFQPDLAADLNMLSLEEMHQAGLTGEAIASQSGALGQSPTPFTD